VAGQPRRGSGGHGIQAQISTFDKRALGRAKAKGKAKEKEEMMDFMGGRPHHSLPADHSFKISLNFVSHFDMSPRCPPKENKAKAPFRF
jgi:hypothetical protein